MNILFMDKTFPSHLLFLIQGLLHFPHVGTLVHVFISQGSVSFDSLVFLVHFLVLSVCVFLILNLGLWLLQDLLEQDFRLACFKLILQCLLIRLYQLLILDVQSNIVLSKPLSADNHLMLSKIED